MQESFSVDLLMSVKANIYPEGEVLEGSTPWLFETAGDVEDGYDYGDDV